MSEFQVGFLIGWNAAFVVSLAIIGFIVVRNLRSERVARLTEKGL